MRKSLSWRPLAMLGLGLLVLAGAGCASKSTSSYVPSATTARQSLETALGAWKKGDRAGRIEAVSPAVQVVDSRWQAGQKLGNFQILAEEPGDGPKWFSVRLTLLKPAGEQVVRYVVVGRDPILVYREDDYKKLSTEM